MKRVFTKLALSFVAVLLSAKVYAYDFTVDGIYYTVTSFENMTCKVVEGDEPYKGDIVIPSTITFNGRTLTVISVGSSFNYNSELTSIKLPDNLTTIESLAFKDCSNLTSIELPDNLTTIEDRAFDGCSSLTSIDLPDGLTTIEYEAFDGCSSLTSIDLPDNLTTIEYKAFYDCSSLTSIDLPDGLTTIEDRAFYGCSSLTSIDLPDGLTTIGVRAFYDCSSLTSIDLPDNLTTIEYEAFSGCSSLTSIDLPDGLTTIEYEAFDGCSSLTSIDIPNSVTSIGCLLVGSDGKLEKLTIGASIEELPTEALYGTGYYYRLFTTAVRRTNGITYESDVSISNLQIADSDVPLTIPELDPSYFYDTQIQNVYAGREIDGEFGIPLKKIEFGGYCTTIARCLSMETLILGQNIETVNPSLIEEQDSLSAIYIKTSTPPQLINNFENKVYLYTKLYVPIGSKSTYQNAEGWKNFWTIEETSDFTGETSISDVQVPRPEVVITFDGITIKESEGAAISVYSIEGKLLYTTTDYKGENIPLRPGIYIIKVNGNSCKVKI